MWGKSTTKWAKFAHSLNPKEAAAVPMVSGKHVCLSVALEGAHIPWQQSLPFSSAVIKTPSPSLLTNLSLKVQMIPKQRNVIRIQLLGIAISLLTLAGKWLNISIHLQGHDRISSGFCHCTAWWLPGHGRNPACKPSAQPSSHCSENANCQQFELEQQLQWNKVEINPLSHPAPFPHRNKLVEPPFIIKCQKNPKQQGQKKKNPTFCCANNHNTARKTFIF